MALGWTFAKNTQVLDQIIKKTVICPPPPSHLVISVANYNFDKSQQCIGSMTIEIDFLQKKSTDSSPYDSDKMAAEFIHFNNQGFTVGQQVRITSQKLKNGIWCLIIHDNCFCLVLFLSKLVFSLWQALRPVYQGHWGDGPQHTEGRTSIWQKHKVLKKIINEFALKCHKTKMKLHS